MKNEYDVVIIDTGVEKEHSRLASQDIDCIRVSNNIDGFFVEELIDGDDDVGHGTAVCDIIKSHCKDISILVIKVFDKELNADESLITDALNYIYHNISCRIINMSLGISVAGYALESVCCKLNDKGIILIAAFDNDGSIAYPAAFKSVVGVTSCNYCTRNSDFIIVNDIRVDIGAKGGLQKVAWIGNSVSIGVGDSYACAHISGICANLISHKQVIGKEQFLKELKMSQRGSENVPIDSISTIKARESVSKYSRVALFPFNKEMHSLIRFADMLSFNIVKIYDVKYSPNIGRSAENILNLSVQSKTIVENVNIINWNEFDTLIIGHTHNLLNNIIKSDSILHLLLSQAEALGKNVFSFDQFPKSFENVPGFVSPPIYQNYAPIPFGKLYHIAKPILAVFGTSSQQGKFSLQLTLRRNLLHYGYKVGQLGTEPTSFLFGMDECVHFGYDSDLKPVGFEFVSLVNSLLNNISSKDTDIILTGGQSATLLTNEGNLAYYPVQQINFLLGTLPDAVILVVNPDDDDRIIGNTISFIESCVATKVIAIVVFPMVKNPSNINLLKTHITEVAYRNLKEALHSKYGLDVFVLDDKNEMGQLTDLIIEYFG